MSSLRVRILAFFLVLLGATVFFYREALVDLIRAVLNREGSSHGIFVPFLSAFFVWTKREEINAARIRSSYMGVLFLGIAIALLMVKTPFFQIRVISFFLFAAGVLILMVGKDVFRSVAFPLFFLVSMAPLPVGIYSALADYIREITFSGAVHVISIVGITFLREGNFLDLPETTLHVARSCSGIRYLISFFFFGIAYAYLYRKTPWGRIIVVASTIPIAIIAGVFRLTSIFLLTYMFGPRMAEHRPHIFISWVVFLIVLFLAVSLDRVYTRKFMFNSESR